MSLTAAALSTMDGRTTLLVDVEDDYEGGIRLYVGHRMRGEYATVDDPAVIADVRRHWPGIVTVPTPPTGCLFRTIRPEAFGEGSEYRP